MRTKCQALAQRHRTQTITHPKPTQHLRSKSLGCRPKAEPQLMKANLAGTLHHSPVLTAGGHEHIVSGETWSCLPGSTSMWCKGRTCSRVEIWAPIPSHGLLRSWLLFLNHTTLSFSLQWGFRSSCFPWCTVLLTFLLLFLSFFPRLQKIVQNFQWKTSSLSLHALREQHSYGDCGAANLQTGAEGMGRLYSLHTWVTLHILVLLLYCKRHFFQKQLCHRWKKSTLNMY